MIKEIDSNSVKCPSCSGPLRPKVMACDECDVEVHGRFAAGAWSRLSESQLQFVQLFVHCEGNIRQMEKAMGVSYPTVKAHLAEINVKLGEPPKIEKSKMPARAASVDSASILDNLKHGTISYEEALKSIRNQGGKHARRNSENSGDE